MSLELDNDGPFAQRRCDEAPTWPVLARLPRVDSPASSAPRKPLPTFAPEPLIGEPLLEHVVEAPLPRVQQPAHYQYADAPHPRLHVESARATASQVEAAAREQLAPGSATRRYRFDQGDVAQRAPRPHRPSADEQASFTDAIFRAHAALSPHMGLVSAAALLLAAGFVYWLAMGRQSTTAPSADRLELGADLTQDDQSPPARALQRTGEPNLDPAATQAPSEAGVSTLTEPKLDEPAIQWSTPPRVAEAPAPSINEAPALRTQMPTSEPADVDAPAGPALSPPEAAATAPSDAATAAAPVQPHPEATLDNGITPTPELDPYPTTPYPAYSFVDQTPAAPAMATAPTAPATR